MLAISDSKWEQKSNQQSFIILSQINPQHAQLNGKLFISCEPIFFTSSFFVLLFFLVLRHCQSAPRNFNDLKLLF